MLRMVSAAVALAAAFQLATVGAASAADPAAGAKVFAVCKACHQVGEKAKNGVGPVLNGIVGRSAGSFEGFKYSEAMKGSGLTWDAATLDEYLKDPKAKVPGNKMTYAGVKDDTKRADLIAYLSQIGADGKLPQ